jgi:hypothetical protein
MQTPQSQSASWVQVRVLQPSPLPAGSHVLLGGHGCVAEQWMGEHP